MFIIITEYEIQMKPLVNHLFRSGFGHLGKFQSKIGKFISCEKGKKGETETKLHAELTNQAPGVQISNYYSDFIVIFFDEIVNR